MHKDILERLPENKVLARELGLHYELVKNWRRYGKIPAKHWPAVIRLARRLRITGVTLDALDKGWHRS